MPSSPLPCVTLDRRDIQGKIYESSSRLNHRLPWCQPHAKVMQGTADFHKQIADACLPQAPGVVDDAAALDAAVDMLDAHAATREAPIRRFLRARESPPPRLLRRHDDFDVVEGERPEAQILEPSAARGQRVGRRLRNPLIVD